MLTGTLLHNWWSDLYRLISQLKDDAPPELADGYRVFGPQYDGVHVDHPGYHVLNKLVM
jgi:hypothetical protein